MRTRILSAQQFRAGRVEVRTEPLTWLHTATLLGDLFSAAARAAAVRLLFWHSSVALGRQNLR